MSTSAVRHDVHINWTAPLYLSLIPFTVHALTLALPPTRSRKAVTRPASGSAASRRPSFSASSSISSASPSSSARTLVPLSLLPVRPMEIARPREVRHARDALWRHNPGPSRSVIRTGQVRGTASELAFYRGTADGDRPSESTTTEWMRQRQRRPGLSLLDEPRARLGRKRLRHLGPARKIPAAANRVWLIRSTFATCPQPTPDTRWQSPSATSCINTASSKPTPSCAATDSCAAAPIPQQATTFPRPRQLLRVHPHNPAVPSSLT